MSILSHHLLNISAKFTQLLPAQPCLLCGGASHAGLCCAACDAELPRLTREHCPICARPTPAGSVCGQCLKQPPSFDHTVAAFSYNFPIDKLIQSLKFHERLVLVNHLADSLADRVNTKARLPARLAAASGTVARTRFQPVPAAGAANLAPAGHSAAEGCLRTGAQHDTAIVPAMERTRQEHAAGFYLQT